MLRAIRDTRYFRYYGHPIGTGELSWDLRNCTVCALLAPGIVHNPTAQAVGLLH